VVAQACSSGAQTITKHGKPVAVVLAISEFQNMKRGPAKKKKSLLEVLQRCPAPEIFKHVANSRKHRDYGRTIALDE
jgi:prevent-host-death family protein